MALETHFSKLLNQAKDWRELEMAEENDTELDIDSDIVEEEETPNEEPAEIVEVAAEPEVRPESTSEAGLRAALQTERQNKRVAQIEAEKSKAEIAEVKELVSRLQKQLEEQQEARAKPQLVVDESEDPIGYAVSKAKQLEDQLQKITGRLTAEDESRQREIEFNNRVETYKRDAAEYAQIVPDYHDAIIFAENAMQRDIYATEAALGRELTPTMVGQLALGRALAMADMAHQQGLSVPEFFYKYAQTLGYNGVSSQTASSAKDNSVDIKKKMEKIKAASEVANSMSDGAPREENKTTALSFSMKGHHPSKKHPILSNPELRRQFIMGDTLED